MSEVIEPPMDGPAEAPFPVLEENIEEARKVFSYQGYREDAKSLWLISFTDLMAVMLAFFVLMYSMSSPREDRWVEVSSALEEGIGDTRKYKGSEWNAGADETIALEKMSYGRAMDVSYLASIIGDLIEKDKRLEKVNLRRERNQVVLVMPEDMVSAQGAAQISESGEVTLAAITDLLRRISNRIEIIGNVDEAEARRARVNGWEIALSRAALVGSSLQAEGYERAISLYATPLARADSGAETVIVITGDDGSQTRALELENNGAP